LAGIGGEVWKKWLLAYKSSNICKTGQDRIEVDKTQVSGNSVQQNDLQEARSPATETAQLSASFENKKILVQVT